MTGLRNRPRRVRFKSFGIYAFRSRRGENWRVSAVYFVAAALMTLPLARVAAQQQSTDDGYRGIWYAVQPSGDEYKYKYSGGFATYPQQHAPIAVYSPRAHKTFFVYGGTPKGKNELLHMVSYYDHRTKTVPRPTILLDKATNDAHDNPVLTIDGEGYLWVFSNSHGVERPSYVHKSKRPFSIDSFDRVLTTNFSYGQAWHLPVGEFLFLHTRYLNGNRRLFWTTSRDGRQWAEPQLLAHISEGDYQVSWSRGGTVGTAFDYHPKQEGGGDRVDYGLNARTNLYYLETSDGGRTWRTAAGEVVATPITAVRNSALVRDYQSEKLLVYLKDLQFDAEGRPVILYLTSKGHKAGPANNPRAWHTARWTGERWEIRPFVNSDSNYDHGSLYVEADGTWRVIAPAVPGPQRYNPGGEVAMWTSRDQGRTWKQAKQLTRDSKRNHTYVRRPLDAHPDFYALWADGDGRQPSESSLYFTNKNGDHVWRLPTVMTGPSARPEIVR